MILKNIKQKKFMKQLDIGICNAIGQVYCTWTIISIRIQKPTVVYAGRGTWSPNVQAQGMPGNVGAVDFS